MGIYRGDEHGKDENDNHSQQLDKETDVYWQDRGYDDRPDDWEDRDE